MDTSLVSYFREEDCNHRNIFYFERSFIYVVMQFETEIKTELRCVEEILSEEEHIALKLEMKLIHNLLVGKYGLLRH